MIFRAFATEFMDRVTKLESYYKTNLAFFAFFCCKFVLLDIHFKSKHQCQHY